MGQFSPASGAGQWCWAIARLPLKPSGSAHLGSGAEGDHAKLCGHLGPWKGPSPTGHPAGIGLSLPGLLCMSPRAVPQSAPLPVCGGYKQPLAVRDDAGCVLRKQQMSIKTVLISHILAGNSGSQKGLLAHPGLPSGFAHPELTVLLGAPPQQGRCWYWAGEP